MMEIMQTRRLAAAVASVGIAAAMALVGPVPAAQALPGLTRVAAVSADDSSATKVVTATCPANTSVIGGGGYVPTIREPSRSGELFITALRPVVSPFGTGFRAQASEDETGFDDSWRLVAVAICAPAPAGLEYRWSTSTHSSASSRTAAVACPSGKRVIGTGGVVNEGGSQVALASFFPTPDALTHAIAQAHEDETGYAGGWSVTAWSVCADPLPGLERVTGVGPHAPGSMLVDCPRAKRLHSVGAVLSGGTGQARLDAAFPAAGMESALVVANEDETGYGQPWSLTAIAVCAN